MIYPDKLYITRHNSDGTIDVEHRNGMMLMGSYIGYPKKDAYKLYPRKGVLHREIRYAGKVVSPRDMILDLPPEPAAPKQPKKNKEKTQQVKLCEQIKMF